MLNETKYEGYLVDDNGNIYSIKSGYLKSLNQYVNNNGYLKVSIEGKTFLSHRIIAETLIGCLEGLTVNHKNGDKKDNRLDNLEIMTYKENIEHAFKSGFTKIGESHSRAKISDDKLISMILEIQNGSSNNKAAKKYGLTQSYVSKVMRGIYRKDIWDKMQTKFNDHPLVR